MSSEVFSSQSQNILKVNYNNFTIIICDECKSEFYDDSSPMKNLCPECAHILYEYENCNHKFENQRCIKCCWNGVSSEYISKLKSEKNL